MRSHKVYALEPGEVADEVLRGGRLVVYEYSISVILMTFGRSTSVRLIRSGENSVTPGLGYTLISLLFGWWGIPWGPIYTIRSVAINLSGGQDVTNEVMELLTSNISATAEWDWPLRN